MAAWGAMTSIARRLGISRSSYSRGFQKVYSLWTAMKCGFDSNRECGRLTLVRAIESTLHSSGVRGGTCGALPLIPLLYWAPSARSERSLMPNLTVTFAHVTMPVPCPTTSKRYTYCCIRLELTAEGKQLTKIWPLHCALPSSGYEMRLAPPW